MPKVREAIKLIEADGWRKVTTKGSHRQVKYPRRTAQPLTRPEREGIRAVWGCECCGWDSGRKPYPGKKARGQRLGLGRRTNASGKVTWRHPESTKSIVAPVARVSKADGSQSLDLQRDALQAAGVDAGHVYHDFASGVRDDRPGLDSCVRALRTGDVLVVWKLDRLGRNLAHLVNTVQDLSTRGVGLLVLTGQGAQIDTTTAPGRLVFGIFAALAEFERELIRERTLAGLTAARAQGRQDVRAVESPGAAGPGRDGAPRHLRVRAVSGARDHPRDALPVRRAAGPVARARREGPRHLNRSALTMISLESVANDRLRHVLIGYARVSKADGSQSLDLQRVALQAAGVDAVHVYHDFASGVRDDRPGLDSCVRALRTGDVLVVWTLDRLGRTLAHLVNTVQELSARGVGLRVLTGQGAQIDTTTAPGRLVFGIFAALAEFERELIRERTLAGLTAARTQGRQDVRAVESSGAAGPGRDGAPRHLRVRALP